MEDGSGTQTDCIEGSAILAPSKANWAISATISWLLKILAFKPYIGEVCTVFPQFSLPQPNIGTTVRDCACLRHGIPQGLE
jgi:hypothetical protein